MKGNKVSFFVILLFVTVIIIASNVKHTAPMVQECFGDINQDGKVTAHDLDKLKRQLVGLEVAELSIADLNDDGRFSLADVVLLKHYLQSVQKNKIGGNFLKYDSRNYDFNNSSINIFRYLPGVV